VTGEIVKTFSTSRLVERSRAPSELVLRRRRSGFKYVADLMLTRNILIGGEESGGIGFRSLSGPSATGSSPAFSSPSAWALLASRCRDRGCDGIEFGALHYDRRDLNRPMDVCARFDRPCESRRSRYGVRSPASRIAKKKTA